LTIPRNFKNLDSICHGEYKMFYFNRVPSTNILALKSPFNSVIVAATQTKGEGRFKRKWQSPIGGLWFSVVVSPQKRPFEYTFIMSLSVIKSIGVGKIKWPNDITYANKKICGILCKNYFQGDTSKIIMGVGINVNNDIPKKITQKAISLKTIKNEETNLNNLLKTILTEFEILSRLSFSKILDQYKSNCGIIGKLVKVKKIDKEIKGQVIDINKSGNLIINTGVKIEEVDEGDVLIQVRKKSHML
jgi:BirA family transcriptional regulator, biotin operon repressor / biotin---[acetyl-CoA-carboxylase] ligase